MADYKPLENRTEEAYQFLDSISTKFPRATGAFIGIYTLSQLLSPNNTQAQQLASAQFDKTPVSYTQTIKVPDLRKELADLISPGVLEKWKPLDKQTRYEVWEAIEKNTDDSPIWVKAHMKGAKLAKEGNFSQAAKYENTSINLNPNNWDAYHNLTVDLVKLNQLDQAKRVGEIAFAIDPNNTNILVALGVINVKLRNFNNAKRFYEAALRIDKNHKIAKAHYSQLIASGAID